MGHGHPKVRILVPLSLSNVVWNSEASGQDPPGVGGIFHGRSHGWKAVGSLRLLKLQGHLEGAADAAALWGQAEMLHFGKGSQWGK